MKSPHSSGQTSEIAEIARYKPFRRSKAADRPGPERGLPGRTIAAEAQKTLMSLSTEIDEFHVHDREVYWLCQKKQSESTFSNALFERKLKVQTTFRGWKTVLKLAAKYPPA